MKKDTSMDKSFKAETKAEKERTICRDGIKTVDVLQDLDQWYG